MGLLSALVGLRDCARADALIATTRQRFTPEDDPVLWNSLDLAQAYSHSCQGHQEEALALARVGLDALKDDPGSAWLSFGRLVLATAAFRKGDLRAASRYEEELREELLLGRLPWAYGSMLWLHLQLTEARYGAERAAVLVRQVVFSSPARTQLLLSEPAAGAWLVRAALTLGHRADAEAVVAVARRLADGAPGHPSLRAAACHARGVLDGVRADLRHAAKRHLDPWARASALEDLAASRAAQHEPERAVADELRKALEAYAAVDSDRDHARIRQRLRGTGLVLRGLAAHHGGDGEAQGADAFGLTESERKVASLVAQGFTNTQVASQLFLSKHTVAFHLRKIFKKLDLTSRAELMHTWNLRTDAA